MSKLRVGVIGIGNMGSSHALQLHRNEIEGAVLTAVCDVRKERIEWAKKKFPENVLAFREEEAFFSEADVDAVIIATPHYQ
ncbi:MAG TPA: Gfo/Idh/MocA family oxidoreductase, partial [Bacillales bacterium]|nr:Gfo/Idh/MocA family oxidoreductase [Bacillales bacterium]